MSVILTWRPRRVCNPFVRRIGFDTISCIQSSLTLLLLCRHRTSSSYTVVWVSWRGSWQECEVRREDCVLFLKLVKKKSQVGRSCLWRREEKGSEKVYLESQQQQEEEHHNELNPVQDSLKKEDRFSEKVSENSISCVLCCQEEEEEGLRARVEGDKYLSLDKIQEKGWTFFEKYTTL